MEEIVALKVIAETLEKLQPEERLRVLGWANAKYVGAAVSPTPKNFAGGISNKDMVSGGEGVGRPKAKASKKSKTTISMDKSLNLTPQGKVSAIKFAADKSPSNVRQKCVVATYYLRDTLELPKVSAQAVFTFFKHVSWPAPADIRNTLQQAGSEGWLDTADGDDIKLTSSGENLVEHNLPSKKA
jgi:hypothetical protein